VRVKWDAKETKLTRNFWIPAMTPEAKAARPEKPDPNVYCPTSGKRLRIKDLIPVKFTPIDATKCGGGCQPPPCILRTAPQCSRVLPCQATGGRPAGQGALDVPNHPHRAD
jgi:hypothetical protein